MKKVLTFNFIFYKIKAKKRFFIKIKKLRKEKWEMKERLRDVVKWGLIIVIAGVVFYLVYPRYRPVAGGPNYVLNTITGQVSRVHIESQE